MKNEGKITEYLNKSFGWDVRFEDLPDIWKRLPYALLDSAELRLMEIDGFKIISVKTNSDIEFRTNKNIVRTIEKRLQVPVVLVLDHIDAHQRRSLIESRINFIVPDKQIYLPAIGIFLNERNLIVKSKVTNELSAIASAVVIIQLIDGSLQGKSVTDVAIKMGYSIKTISLIVNELKQHGLISVKKSGRKKLLDFKLEPKDLWAKAFPLMKSPVEKRMFTSDISLAEKIGVKASDSALSEVSMLAPPRLSIYAVYARDNRLKELQLNSSDGTAIIEIWKIDPHQTSKEGITDIFSLALTYKDDDDPRVNKELNNVINKNL